MSVDTAALERTIVLEKLDETYSLFFGLWEALKALFAREIDLIEASTVKNPYIGQAIHASRVMVYSAPVDNPPSS